MLNAKRIATILASVMSLYGVTALAEPPIDYAEGRILVKGKAGITDARLAKILDKANARALRKLEQIGTHVVEVPPQAEDAVIKALMNNPHIDFAEKDMLMEATDFLPNDPRYSNQWHLPKIQAPAAWSASTGQDVTIAIADSGVEASHPDLVNSLVPGWNVASNNSDTSPVTGHGTRVAGSAAATGNNGTGVASVAWSANIMPLRITDRSDGWAYWSDMAEAITWAADHGADVVNVSYDIGNSSTVTNAAQYMRNRGGVVLTSAGNSNTDHGYSDNPYIIHVAATTSSDAKASFSNYGNEIDIAAPGSSIHTTTTGGGYTSSSGTSHASPVATGVVALIMAANPRLSPAEVEAILEESADDLGNNGWDPVFGHGRVNAGAAVALATGTSTADTQSPGVSITSPAYNETISGSVLVNVDASDNVGITEVILHANGQPVGSDSTRPYEFSWDSTKVDDGNVTLTAYAYDAAGNTGISSGVNVSVDNVTETVDTTPPSAAIYSPAAGAVVNGIVSVAITASDDTAVELVRLRANGVIVGDDNTAPYKIDWDSTQVANGNVTLSVRVWDTAGNMTDASSVISVENQTVDTTPPSVSIINPPAASGTVSGTINIDINASDDTGVTHVDLIVNGQKVGSDSTSPYQINWDTTNFPDGSASIVAQAHDEAGNIGASSPVAVTVKNAVKQDNDTSAPIVMITSPSEGETVSGTVNIHASAGDNVGVTQIEIYLDGSLFCSGTDVSYLDCSWNTRKESNGSHSISAVAWDAAGNRANNNRTVSVGETVKGNGNGNGKGNGKNK